MEEYMDDQQLEDLTHELTTMICARVLNVNDRNRFCRGVRLMRDMAISSNRAYENMIKMNEALKKNVAETERLVADTERQIRHKS